MNAIATRGEGSTERHEIVALARELGRRELAPHALELDERRPGALEAAWGRLAEVGFDRALLAVDDGGVGLDSGTLLLCLEEIACGDGGVAMLMLLANAALAAMPAEMAIGIGAAERWALVPAPPEELATGARIEVAAAPGDEAALTGTLSPALGALGADGVVVLERGTEATLLVLPAGTPGLRIEACGPQLGLRGAAGGRVSLSGTIAAAPALAPREAAVAATDSLALLRAGAAAIARGIARRAYDLALAYAETRVQGGAAIVEHDAVRDMLTAMAIRHAARPAPLGTEPDEAAVLAVKVAATDAAVATTTDAVQVFGGTGYMHETGVEKLMRDAKYLQLWPEPNWMARDRLMELLR